MSTAAERLAKRVSRLVASDPIPADLRNDIREVLRAHERIGRVARDMSALWSAALTEREGCVLVPVPLMRRLHAEAVESRDCHLEGCARRLPDGTADLNSLDPEERETHDELDAVVRQAEALLPPEQPVEGGAS